MTAADLTPETWDRYEAEIEEASDPAVIARALHPSSYVDRSDLTVVTRRPASETIRLADALTLWIALRYPPDGLLAYAESWSPFQWAAVAAAAEQPAPTSAVQCVVLGHIRKAAGL